MGTAKAGLEWHGSTLLRRTAGVLSRAVDGPVVVVRAPGQPLPDLPAQVEIVDDPREGLGPVQGLAAGLAAVGGRAEIAFVAATDLPFLHPAFVGRVLRAAADGVDVALPLAHGHPQPLAAAYRTALAAVAARLVARRQLRPAFLFGQCEVARLDEGTLRADPVLAALDPALDSVVNVNTPAEYQRARTRPAPEVTVRLSPHIGDGHGPRLARAATVAGAAAAAGLAWGPDVVASLNRGQATGDGEAPLAAGDDVLFLPIAAAARGGHPR